MNTQGGLLQAKKLLQDIGLQPGNIVADFGAGRTGHIVFPAANMVGSDGIVYAVDIVKEVLSMIDGRAKLFGVTNLHTVWGDFEKEQGVRIKEHSLDWVFVVNNVWCVKDVSAMLSEIKRVLKPEGRICVIDWARRAHHPAAPPVHQRKEAMEIEAIFLRHGIAKERELSVNQTHWGLVFRLS